MPHHEQESNDLLAAWQGRVQAIGDKALPPADIDVTSDLLAQLRAVADDLQTSDREMPLLLQGQVDQPTDVVGEPIMVVDAPRADGDSVAFTEFLALLQESRDQLANVMNGVRNDIGSLTGAAHEELKSIVQQARDTESALAKIAESARARSESTVADGTHLLTEAKRVRKALFADAKSLRTQLLKSAGVTHDLLLKEVRADAQVARQALDASRLEVDRTREAIELAIETASTTLAGGSAQVQIVAQQFADGVGSLEAARNVLQDDSAEIRSARTELSEASHGVRSAHAELRTLQSETLALRAALEESIASVSGAHGRFEAANTELARTNAGLSARTSEVANVTQTLTLATTNLESIGGELTSTQRELAAAVQAVKEWSALAQVAKQAEANARDAIAARETALATARHAREEAEFVRNQLADQIAASTAQLEQELEAIRRDSEDRVAQSNAQASDRVREAEERVEQANARVREFETRVAQSETRLAASDARVSEAEQQLATARARVKGTADALRDAEVRVVKTTAALREAEARLQHAEARVEEIQRESRELLERTRTETAAEIAKVRREAGDEVASIHAAQQQAAAQRESREQDEALRRAIGLLSVLESLDDAVQALEGQVSDLAAERIEKFESDARAMAALVELNEIDTSGAFDPDSHESIATISCDRPAGTIVEVRQRGYAFRGRVVRPAQVVVSA